MKRIKVLSFALSLALLFTMAVPILADEHYLRPEEVAFSLWDKSVAKVPLKKVPKDAREAYFKEIAQYYGNLDTSLHSLNYFYYAKNPDEYYFSVKRSKEDSDKELRSIQLAQKIVHPFKGRSVEDQINLVHEYILQNTTYDYDEYGRFVRGEKIINEDAFSAYGVLFKNKAVCQGYSGAFMQLCDALSIPCIKVSGELKGVPHSWNAVYLKDRGQWRYIDVTTNDALFDLGHLDKKKLFYLVEANKLEQNGYTWSLNEEKITRAMKAPLAVGESWEKIKDKGWIHGRGGGDLALNENLTRNELAVLLVNMETQEKIADNLSSPFNDVPKWAGPYVAYCYQKGWLQGMSANTFSGQTPVTKQQMDAVALRLVYPGEKVAWNRVEDTAIERGLVNRGRSSQIRNTTLLRADLIEMLGVLSSQ